MRVVFRTDASVEIGSGHVTRCATLAQELVRRGAEVHFICRAHEGKLTEWLSGEPSMVVHVLSPRPASDSPYPSSGITHEHFLGCSWQNDVLDTLSRIYLLGEIDWLVVDHYALDALWEKALRPFVKRLFIIDDLADRIHDADLLLDQNYHPSEEDRYTRLVSARCQRLIGPKYALLRPEFARARASSSHKNFPPRKILIFFGGSDKEGLTNRVLRILLRLENIGGLQIRVLPGIINCQREDLLVLGRKYPNITIEKNYIDMAEAMLEADFFVGTGGATTWERCCLGLPSVIMASGMNQCHFSKALAEDGAQIYLGSHDQVSDDRIFSTLAAVLKDPHLMTHLSRTAFAVTDGQGVRRVADILDPVALQLRPARRSDSDLIYEWRNHPKTRRYSFNRNNIDVEEHRKWFSGILAHDNKTILIGEMKGEPIGVIRLDFEQTQAHVSIYMSPDKHNVGLGTRLLEAASEWTRTNIPQINIIQAEVIKENYASNFAFTKAGYQAYSVVFKKDLKVGAS